MTPKRFAHTVKTAAAPARPSKLLLALGLLAAAVGVHARFQDGGGGAFRGEVYMKPPVQLAAGPVEWVAGGPGVLAYGSGREIVLALDSTPLLPVAKLRLDNPASGAVFFGRYLYLAESGTGLRAIDTSDPEHPAEAGSLALPAGAVHLAALGDHLLVASDDAGVRVLAVGMEPADAMEVGFVPIQGRLSAFAAEGDRAFLAVEGSGLAVLDLTDPSRPYLLDTAQLPFPVNALALSGGLLYASSPSAGLVALDPAGLSSPSPLAQIGDAGVSLYAAGRRLYVASPSRGLLAVETGSAAAQTVNVNVGTAFFQPATVNINQGDSVKWTWIGGTHSTTSGACSGGNCAPDGKWNSGEKSSGTFTHLFADAGNNPYFCSVHLSSQTGTVKVAAGPALLSASSSASPAGGQAPLQVLFTGTAAGGTPPYTFAWDFGDSGTSADQNPGHTYAAPETYSVVLTVRDSAGGSAPALPITISVSDTTVPPPSITAMAKMGNPFRILVTGNNFQSGIQTSINGTPWTNFVLTDPTTLKLKGGKALKALVPKDTPALFHFVNPDGGEASFTFRWP